MNGNWGGIASQDFERPNRHIEGLEDPSLDVINTIIASYAASAIDENESRDNDLKENHKSRQNNRDQYYYRDPHHRDVLERDIGIDRDVIERASSNASPQKSSTPRNKNRHSDSANNRSHDRYIHPLALKLKLQEASGKDGTNSSDAQSNAATDNESEHRSEGGESFTATNNEVSNAINAVTKKLHWATVQLEETTSYDGSINAVKLISECALTISNLKRARSHK